MNIMSLEHWYKEHTCERCGKEMVDYPNEPEHYHRLGLDYRVSFMCNYCAEVAKREVPDKVYDTKKEDARGY